MAESRGRPTKYKDSYCEEIIPLSSNLNMYEIAAKWEVCYDTLQEWAHAHPDFSVAYTRARTIQTGKLIRGIISGDINPKAGELVLTHVASMSSRRKLQVRGLNKGTLEQRSVAVLDALSEGDVDVDELQKIITSISLIAKIEESTELRPWLEEIEKKLKEKR